MNVIVRGKNKFEPTDAIKKYAEGKLQRIEHYFNKWDDLVANVLCKVYDSYHEVEITIPTKHVILRAEVKDKTMYGAIDLAVDKLELQISKHKSKIFKSIQQRQGVGKYYADKFDFDVKEFETELRATQLVKNKTVDLVPMTADEAILQMEMLGHDFYLFMNSDTSQPSVVYLREDHDYGIIEGIQNQEK